MINAIYPYKTYQKVNNSKKVIFKNKQEINIDNNNTPKNDIWKTCLFGASTMLLSIGVFACYNKNLLNFKSLINKSKFKFTSLENDISVPTIDTCNSLDKNLRAKLRRQIKLNNVDKNILEEVGVPSASNRLLISGSPGIGKSYFAKIYAKSINAEYMEVLYSDIDSKWVGDVDLNIRNIFETIMKNAKKNPSKNYVVTFNEIDNIIVPIENLQGSPGGSTHWIVKREVRSTFLNYLEILKQKTPNVTIIGTTNLPLKSNSLDSAAMSRFETFEVPYPNAECLYEALIENLKTLKDSEKFIKENKEDIRKLATTMAKRKCSYRDLNTIMNEAKVTFIEDKADNKTTKFTFEYLQKAQQHLSSSDGEREMTFPKNK